MRGILKDVMNPGTNVAKNEETQSCYYIAWDWWEIKVLSSLFNIETCNSQTVRLFFLTNLQGSMKYLIFGSKTLCKNIMRYKGSMNSETLKIFATDYGKQ